MTVRILLVEDDAVTRAFLTAATQALPALVDAAESVAAALRMAREHSHDLWLIDANLADGDGFGLLVRLRGEGLRTPAIAHTAAHEDAVRRQLLAGGFAAVLTKPMTANQLHGAIRSVLATTDASTTFVATPAAGNALPSRIWDDEAALSALNGQRAHVDALRQLFRQELPGVSKAVQVAAGNGDVDALHAALHRLRASCGFVGATRLAAAVASLQAVPHSYDALSQFVRTAQATLSSD